MSERLTRREIKNDEILEVIDHILIFGRDHWRELVGAAVAVIVILLGYWGYSLREAGQATEAQVALAKGLRIAGATIDTETPSPNDLAAPSFPDEASRELAARPLFEAVLVDWSGSAAAMTAEMYLADLDVNSGASEVAIERWERVSEKGPGATAAVAEMNIIQLARSEGRLEDGRSRLESQLDRKDSPLPQDAVLSELAAILEELGDEEGSQSTYSRLVDEHPTSPFSFQAQRKLADRSL